jgi:hypothetical protein
MSGSALLYPNNLDIYVHSITSTIPLPLPPINDLTISGRILAAIQNSFYRFKVAYANAAGQPVLKFDASLDAQPAGPGYGGLGAICTIGSSTALGDPDNRIGEGVESFGLNSLGGTMNTTNYGVSRMKPLRVTITDTVAGITQTLFNASTLALLWRSPIDSVDAINVNALEITCNKNINLNTVGNGLKIKSGANCRMGTVQMNGSGSASVSNTTITANTLIFTSVQAPTSSGIVAVASQTPGVGFVLGSTNGSDASIIAWMLVERT